MRRPHRRALTGALAALAVVVAGVAGLQGGIRAGAAGVAPLRAPATPNATSALPVASTGVPALASSSRARLAQSAASAVRPQMAGRASRPAADAGDGPATARAQTLHGLARPGAAGDPERGGAAAASGREALPPPPVFHLYKRPGDPAVAIVGFDPAAPRILVLWRLDPAARVAAPVARMRSEASGAFAVDRLLLSVRGARLVVTGAAGDPFGPEASPAVYYPPRTREEARTRDVPRLEETP